MSNVPLSIGGREYTVACAAGEEAHIAMLGRLIDEKLRAMGGVTSQSETRQLLFAALLLADEVHEAGKRPAPASAAPAPDTRTAERLEAIAARLENCASSLEGEADKA